MSKKSPKNEIKLLTIEEVDFDLPEVEPAEKDKKDKQDKKPKKIKFKYLEESKETKGPREKKSNRIKR